MPLGPERGEAQVHLQVQDSSRRGHADAVLMVRRHGPESVKWIFLFVLKILEVLAFDTGLKDCFPFYHFNRSL